MTWVLLTVAVVGAWLAGRATACNFRHWRATRRRPQVLATEDGLTEELEDWPWKGHRWPDPGAPGDWRLGPRQCRAYVRIARERAFRQRTTETVMGLFIAAVVGMLVPRLGSAYAVMTEDVDPLSTGGALLAVFRPGARPLLYVALLCALPILLAGRLRDYEVLARAYEHAATAQEAEAAAPSEAGRPQRGRLRRALDRIRSIGSRPRN